MKDKTKMHKKINDNGITLIALVITIIVMLILVGVTVTVALNGGLFKSARKATSDTEVAREAESELSNGQVNIDNTIYNSIEEYISGNKSEENLEETLKVTLKVDEANVTGASIPVSVSKIMTNESEEKEVDNNFKYKWFINDVASGDDNTNSLHTFSDLDENQSYKIKCLVTDNSTGDSGSAELTVLSFQVVDTLYRGTLGMTWPEWIKSGYAKPFPLNEEHYLQFLTSCGWCRLCESP